MKKILALSLSLFVLANTITVSQTKALPKKVAAKLASGVTFGGLSVLSAVSAIQTYNVLNTPMFRTFADAGIASAIKAPLDLLLLTYGVLALTSGTISAISFKSAYNDVKN